MTSPVFVGYWAGYQSGGNTLNETPPSVTNVNLFVAAPAPDGKSVDTNYLCKAYPCPQQMVWAAGLQNQGQQVSMTFMDTPSTHWNNVDIPAFAASVNTTVLGNGPGQWGLNGVDVDAESGMPDDVYVKTMVSLVTNLREAIGPDALLTYTAYTLGMKANGGSDFNHDGEIIPQIAESINWVNMMGYFWDTGEQETAFAAYAGIVGPEKVTIGIGVCYQDGVSTPLDECSTLAAWQPASGSKAGMMLFVLNNDNPDCTGQPQWTWVNTIANSLASGAAPNAVAGAAGARPNPARRLHRTLPWSK